jgi:adenosine kinase
VTKSQLRTAPILTGSIAIDRIMNFEGSYEEAIKPDKLHVLSLSVLLSQLVDTHGGIAANIAYNLAMLGDQPVLLGAVGSNARDYMAQLQTLGVNTEFIHYSELPTATFTVMTDANGCQVGGFYPGAMSDEGLTQLPEVVAKLDAQSKANVTSPFIVISAHDPELMARQVNDCQKNNYRLFYDASQQISNLSAHDLQQGVEAAELLILNDYEMEVLQQKTGWSLLELRTKVPVIIVTLGEKGCLIYDSRAKAERQATLLPTEVKAVPNIEAIDPTGAGDAFRAGFLYGYLRDWSLVESAQLGCVVASFAVERKGTQEHQLHWEKIKNRYQTSYKESHGQNIRF